MNEHIVTSNASLRDDEEPEKSSFFSGQCNQLSVSASIPPQESSKSLAFNTSTTPSDSSLKSCFPPEILIQIFKNVIATRDLLHCTLVSRMWCECAIELLWQDVTYLDVTSMSMMGRVFVAPRQTFTYARFVRRLVVDPFSIHLEVFLQFIHCDNLEHLNISKCSRVPEEDLIRVFARLQNLTIINLADCFQVTNDLLVRLAHTTKRLEDINLKGCNKITDKGISALAGGCPGLRCIDIKSVFSITDSALTSLAKSCPLLMRIDLSFCHLVTNLGVQSLWQYSSHMRDISLCHCQALNSKAFPALPTRSEQKGLSGIDSSLSSPALASTNDTRDVLLPLTLSRAFDHNQLMNLDLSGCPLVTDDTLERIISHAPNIQRLCLSGCSRLTVGVVETICKLGKSLQCLDFDCSAEVTDSSIRLLARSCVELQTLYIGTCTLVTLAAIHFLLQRLDKLTLLFLLGFPPFWDPELQEAYSSTYAPDAKQMMFATNRMKKGVFSSPELSQLQAFLAGLQEDATTFP